MSKSKRDAAEEVHQVNKKPTVVETLYDRHEILLSPSAFGVSPEMLAGALALVKGDKLSRKQVVDAIELFKKREVK